MRVRHNVDMPSYTVALWCGGRVYVSCHARTGSAHTRIIGRRGPQCHERRRHAIGVRLWLWEVLPDRREQQPTADVEMR